MKLIVFGATGIVGKELVKQALFNGNTAKAYGRNVFTAALPEDEKLELVQGALFDEDHVYKAIKGCDAVLSALGGEVHNATDKTRSLGVKNIARQMQKAGLKRIVAVGGFGILDADETGLVMDEKDFPPEHYVISQEHLRAYEILKETELEWTIVCPFMIRKGDPTGEFDVEAERMPAGHLSSISTGDLALFMLKELEQKKYLRQRVGISY